MSLPGSTLLHDLAVYMNQQGDPFSISSLEGREENDATKPSTSSSPSSPKGIYDLAGSTTSNFLNALSFGLFSNHGSSSQSDMLVLDTKHLAYIIQELSQLNPTELEDWERELFEAKEAGYRSLRNRWMSSSTLTSLLLTPFQNSGDTFMGDLKVVHQRLIVTRGLKLGPLDPRPIINNQGMVLKFTQKISLGLVKKLRRLEIFKLNPSQLSGWDSIATGLKELVCTKSLTYPEELLVEVFPENVMSDMEEPYWKQLSKLDLSNNTLMDFSSSVGRQVTSCRSLSLSRNSFEKVPEGLKELFMLHTLNLSRNAIASTRSIDHILGNIHTLDLSHNQLESIDGINKLWALVSLDLRNNLISEVEEIGRLNALPSLRVLRVANNPFCKKVGYVKEMFEYFSHVEMDFLIDGQKPTSTPKLPEQQPSSRQFTPQIPSSPISPPSVLSVEKVPVKGKVSRRVATIRTASGSEQGRDSPTSFDFFSNGDYPSDKDKNSEVGDLAPATRVVRLTDSDELQFSSGLQSPLTSDQMFAPSPRPLRRKGTNKGRMSPNSILSPSPSLLSVNSPLSNGDAFRKRIEAMRKEAGTTWLKVLNETQTQKQTEPRTPGSQALEKNPSNLTMATPNFEYLQPQSETKADSPSPDLPSSSKSVADDKEVTAEENLLESDTDTSLANEPAVILLPEGEQFEVLWDEVSIEDNSGRLMRPSDSTHALWILTGKEIFEADRESHEILSRKDYESLMRVVVPQSRARCIRAEFKSSRYDVPTFYDVTVANTKQYHKLLGLLKDVVKTNLDHGLLHDRYKQAKCLSCAWVGVLPDKFSHLTRRGVTQFPEHEMDKTGTSFLNFFIGSKVQGSSEESGRGCPQCKGSFLVDFYGHEKQEAPSVIPSLASSKLIANLGSFLSSKPSPEQESESTCETPSTLPGWIEGLPGYQAKAQPFQTINNALRLYIDLQVLEQEGESLAGWLAVTYIPQAPVFYNPPPPKWSLRAYTGHMDPLPEIMPPEQPLYVLLSSQCLYLFEPNSGTSLDPEAYLQLKFRLPLGSIARIDVGCNRQTLTFHFRLHEKNPKTGVYNSSPNALADQLPQSSYTVLVRDKILCSKFLDSLLEILYEFGLGKLVNHNVLWAVQNLRKEVFLRPNLEIPFYRVNGQLLPATNLPCDQATGDDVVVDKVTFDFLKFVGQVAYVCPNSTVEHAVLVVTDSFIYLCSEKYHVWPPAVTELESLAQYSDPETSPRRLACSALPQYSPIEALAIHDVDSILTYEVTMSCRLGLPPNEISLSFKLALELYGIPPPPLSPWLIPLPPSPPTTPPIPFSSTSGSHWRILFTSVSSAQEFLDVIARPSKP